MKYLKTFENMAMAKSIISKKMEAFDKLKNLLSKNLGYIGKFTEYLMNENIPYSDLELIYKDLLDLKNKQKNLDISNLKYEEVVDKIQDVKNDLSINSLIQKFPSEQKKLAKELLKSNYNILLQTSKKDNIDALISKISRYKTKEELKNALSLFGKESINEKEKILEYVKSSDSANIAFQNENILIVKINKIEDVKKLGSDTSWCILSEGMWRRYTTNRYQYILYNFEKDNLNPHFKIGFTLNKDYSIHAAHDILDRSVIDVLNDIIYKNNINYSELIPKIEKIEVTEEMISNIKSRTTLSTLKSYSESIDIELIPKLISKIIDYLPKRNDIIEVKSGKAEVLSILINKYFTNTEYVKINDLKNLDKRLPSVIKKVIGYHSKTLKDKLIGDKPNFDLPANIVTKTLDIWDDKVLIYGLSSRLNSINVPGESYFYSGDTLRFNKGWTKDYIKILSDKMNDLWKNSNWKDILKEYNDYMKDTFILNYVILNYISGRKYVDKWAIDNIRERDKITYAYLLKLPIDLSKDNWIRTAELSEWSIPLIIKKDYDNIEINIDNLKNASNLINHLESYNIKFKISKTYLERVRTSLIGDGPFNYRNNENNHKLLDILNKFKSRPRVRDQVTSDDGLITIEYF